MAAAWPGFLAPDDVVSSAEPEALMSQLSAGLAGGPDERAFPAANRLALEAFRAGDVSLAEQICRLEIGYAVASYRPDADKRVMLFGLQPVINLIRLDGYAGSVATALAGLDRLERVADGRPARIHGLGVTAEVLGDPAVAPRLRALAKNTCLVETAKILWRRGRAREMAAAAGRLSLKWPRSLDSGPYHAAEAAWLLDADACARSAGLPRAPALRRICSLHLLGQASQRGAADVNGLASELFTSRARGCQGKPSPAAARDLAFLGDSLIRIGQAARGRACLGEAHQTAARDDPALANQIRRRWLEAAGPSGLPAELPCPRLPASALAAATSLAAARFAA